MKLKVLVGFYDKYTNELYEIGKELDVEEARGQELLASTYVELIAEKEIKTTKKKKEE